MTGQASSQDYQAVQWFYLAVHLTRSRRRIRNHHRMIAIGILFARMLCDCFKPRHRLEAEILLLRHQLNVLQQRASRRVHLRWVDRALFIWLYVKEATRESADVAMQVRANPDPRSGAYLHVRQFQGSTNFPAHMPRLALCASC